MIHDFNNKPFEEHSVQSTDFRSDIERLNSSVSVHNNSSNDHSYVRNLSNEIINTSGVELLLYHRTDNNDYSDTFDEDVNPTYWEPYILKGYFKPQPSTVELTKFGIDNKNKAEIIFSKNTLFGIAGDRLIRSGDIIKPNVSNDIHKSPHYVVVTAVESGQYRYTWLYISCKCELAHGDITIIPKSNL